MSPRSRERKDEGGVTRTIRRVRSETSTCSIDKQKVTVMAGLVPRLSGLNFWTKCMALILLGSERFATFWTRKEFNTMRHHNSVLHQVLKLVPWAVFERLVDEAQADKHVRRLSTKSQLIALLYGQLSGAGSLREIEAG